MIHLYYLLRTVTLISAWMGTPTMWKRETLKLENGADPDINRTPIVTPLKRTLFLQTLEGLNVQHVTWDMLSEKAPEWWELNLRIAKLVELQREHDAEFQSLLRA
ncbi:hypothetical protein GGP41_002218 [Bipolaris sorokiniana]|uniref:Uncharacterized protein n=1 Tax=Cochliobolus sativus TaxID=45130 RepID=A0A8H5Z8M9_COCSA|nr:hypothetical protein GGP41_002218 [Bipolaris sorokiniana]